MTNVANRITLAEAMGWTNIHMKHIAMECESYPFGCVPGNVNDTQLSEQIPDPYTNAIHCEELIQWLQQKGFDVEIWWSGTAFTHRTNVNCRVKIKYRSDWEMPKEGDAHDDWKQGVCAAALKHLTRVDGREGSK